MGLDVEKRKNVATSSLHAFRDNKSDTVSEKNTIKYFFFDKKKMQMMKSCWEVSEDSVYPEINRNDINKQNDFPFIDCVSDKTGITFLRDRKSSFKNRFEGKKNILNHSSVNKQDKISQLKVNDEIKDKHYISPTNFHLNTKINSKYHRKEKNEKYNVQKPYKINQSELKYKKFQ